MANLFNNFPGLDPPKEELDIVEETREEKVSSTPKPGWRRLGPTLNQGGEG